jgi:hypothetical protein
LKHILVLLFIYFSIFCFKLVEQFFKPVKEIQSLLHNHIFVTIKRMLEVSKMYPEQLVTALRIIEREEMYVLRKIFDNKIEKILAFNIHSKEKILNII